MSVLGIKGLTVSAGAKTLVRDVSLNVEQGEIFALVGESGSGKTLTALSVMGLLPAGLRMSVEIKVGPGGSFLRGKDAAMIFQEPMTSLNPLHTIGRQIGEAIRIHNQMTPPQVRERVLELLDKVGLGAFKARLDAYPHQLSGGERQRVMIAMAIANNPMLLIADEPTTALDVTIQAQILALIDELRKSLHMAVLLITHDLPLVRRIADRVGIMSRAEIVETGRTAEVFASPQHPYTRSLLASQPGKAPAPAKRNGETLMECKGLSITFTGRKGILSFGKVEKTVIEDISFSIPSGTTLGVVGESGSGKTSLALALLRLIPSKGEIRLAGAPIEALSGAALRARRRDMQIVFQDPYSSLNPRMTAGAIITEGLGVHAPGMKRAEKQAALETVLREVGLEPEVAERYAHEFSGGQRQRISIARALILKPRLLILDEPTSALDLSVQAQVLELLKGLQQKYGLTYIFISHDLRVVRAISHRILVLQHGRMVETGEARQILEAPKEDYTRALVKAALL
jgi:microcin C transport system ATP-binding protein